MEKINRKEWKQMFNAVERIADALEYQNMLIVKYILTKDLDPDDSNAGSGNTDKQC